MSRYNKPHVDRRPDPENNRADLLNALVTQVQMLKSGEASVKQTNRVSREAGKIIKRMRGQS